MNNSYIYLIELIKQINSLCH